MARFRLSTALTFCACIATLPLDAAPLRAITPMDLMNVRVVGGMGGTGLSVSPDGAFVAFEMHQADVAANGYRATWFVSALGSARQALKVGDAGDATLFRATGNGAWISQAPKWSQDSRWIFYRRKEHGATQVWRSSRDGARQEQVTHEDADVEQFELLADGSLIYSTDAPREELQAADAAQGRKGYHYDPQDAWSIVAARPYTTPPYRLVGGRPRIVVQSLRDGTLRKATSAQAGWFDERQQAPQQRKIADRPLSSGVFRAEQGKAVAWLEYTNPQEVGPDARQELYWAQDGEPQHAIRCPSEECSKPIGAQIKPVAFSTDGAALYISRSMRGETSFYEWRAAGNAVRRILTTEDALTDCQLAQHRLMCLQQTPVWPATIVAVNLADGSIQTLVDVNPDFTRIRLTPVTRLKWSDASGREMFGNLVMPAGYDPHKRYPLIIVDYRAKRTFSGGGADEYPVHVFAAHGFAVLVYDFPDVPEVVRPLGLTEFFRERYGGKELLEAQIPFELLEAGIDVLDRRGLIDPARVGITGFSTGVQVVNYGVIHSKRFAAASITNPLWDPTIYYLGAAASAREALTAGGFGRPGGSEDRTWNRLSLARNPQAITTPLLINSSQLEHFAALEDMTVLSEEGRPIEMHVFPDEEHVKWYPAHRYNIYRRNLQWFEFWLCGNELDDPVDTEQYVRWRELRKLSSAS